MLPWLCLNMYEYVWMYTCTELCFCRPTFRQAMHSSRRNSRGGEKRLSRHLTYVHETAWKKGVMLPYFLQQAYDQIFNDDVTVVSLLDSFFHTAFSFIYSLFSFLFHLLFSFPSWSLLFSTPPFEWSNPSPLSNLHHLFTFFLNYFQPCYLPSNRLPVPPVHGVYW